MGVTEEQLKKFEKVNKEMIYKTIQIAIEKEADCIKEIETISKDTGYYEKIPNMGITLNNKLGEISNEFKSANISMYAKKVENYGKFKQSYVNSSFVGDAIMNQLAEYFKKGEELLQQYSDELDKIDQNNKPTVIEKNPIKRIINKIKKIFTPKEQPNYTENKYSKANEKLKEYSNIDEELYQYNIKDNIAEGLVKHMRKEEYHVNDIPSLVNEFIMPDLTKLGYGNLETTLKQKIVEEYKKEIPKDTQFYKLTKEEKKLYVPDFNKKEETNTEKNQTEHISQEDINKLIEETRKLMNNSGIEFNPNKEVKKQAQQIHQQIKDDDEER